MRRLNADNARAAPACPICGRLKVTSPSNATTAAPASTRSHPRPGGDPGSVSSACGMVESKTEPGLGCHAILRSSSASLWRISRERPRFGRNGREQHGTGARLRRYPALELGQLWRISRERPRFGQRLTRIVQLAEVEGVARVLDASRKAATAHPRFECGPTGAICRFPFDLIDSLVDVHIRHLARFACKIRRGVSDG